MNEFSTITSTIERHKTGKHSYYLKNAGLVERAGLFKHQGSITALYTVLVEGDDFNEPIADAMRSLLDGHVVLTRELAELGHYPAIDVLLSLSRLTFQLDNNIRTSAIWRSSLDESLSTKQSAD